MLGTLEGHESPVNGVAFSPDGKQAVSVSGNLQKGNDAGPFEPNLRVKGEKPTPRSSGSAGENALRLWDIETRKMLKKIELLGAGKAVYFSADGKLALVVTNNGTQIYDLVTGEDIAAARTAEERFPAGMLSGDRKTAVSKAIGSAAIVNAVSGENFRPLEGPINGMPLCNAFSQDGSRVILGTGKVGFFSREPNEPGSVYVYEVASGRRLANFEGHGHEVTQVGISADGKHAFSRDEEKTLFLWAIK
jgi:WD40 repeat protein